MLGSTGEDEMKGSNGGLDVTLLKLGVRSQLSHFTILQGDGGGRRVGQGKVGREERREKGEGREEGVRERGGGRREREEGGERGRREEREEGGERGRRKEREGGGRREREEGGERGRREEREGGGRREREEREGERREGSGGRMDSRYIYN